MLQAKTPVEVAIELNLDFEEARKYWTEFLRLQKMNELYQIYVDNEYHLDDLFRVYYFLLRNQVDRKNFENVLGIAYDTSKLYQMHSNLKTETEKLEQTKNNYQNNNNRWIIEKISNPGPCPYGIPPITWRFITRNDTQY